MKLDEQNILLFTRTMEVGGTENVVLQLCEILQPLAKKIVVCSCGGVNVKKLEVMGIQHYEIPDIEKKTPQNIVQAIVQVNNIVKKEKITVIHTHHRMAAFITHFIKTFERIYMISTLHGTFSDKHYLTRFAYGNANIIACGNAVKNNFVEEFKIPNDRITVITNAIKKDESKIIPIPELKGKKDHIKIGYIGRLSKEKGIDILINAIGKSEFKMENIYFFVVGNGPLESELKSMVCKYNLKEKVYFLGHRNDVQNVMRQLDFIVLPSLTEGLPLTPMEAFANKKTVIATTVGGNTEIIKNGENGILVEPNNEKALAEAIYRLSNNPDMLKQLSNQAEKTYQKKYSYEIFRDAIICYYESL